MPLKRFFAEILAADAALEKGHGRPACIMALKAVNRLLRDTRGYASPAIAALSVALQNAERGHSEPLLAPGRASRPLTRAQREMAMASAAAAMEAYQRAGVKQAEAARRVARALARQGFNLGGNRYGGAPSAQTVLGWAKRCRQSPSSFGGRFYAGLLSAGADDDAQTRAEALLNWVELACRMGR